MPLATKDYIGTRFSEFETRVDTKVDKYFAQMGTQFTGVKKYLVEVRGEKSEICATPKLQSQVSAVLIARIFIPFFQKPAI